MQYINILALSFQVWDGSWKYSKSDMCLRLWFDGRVGNPNDGIAQHYAHLVVSAASVKPNSVVISVPLALTLIIATLMFSDLLL